MSKIKNYFFILLIIFLILIFFLIYNYFNILWSYLLIEIQSYQRGFHLQLSQSINDIKKNGLVISIGLIILSFIYGVFHAIGPGHGKIIISTYLLTQENKLRRGILLSVSSSLFQGATAIFSVSIVTIILNFTFRDTIRLTFDIEIVSYFLISLVGLFIIFSKFFKIFYKLKLFFKMKINILKPNFYTYNDNKKHHHNHGPSLDEINSSSLKSLLSIAFAIGIRPCSGAIIVLLLSFSLKLYFAGLISVLVMSLGTGLTTSVLATLSVYGRKTALKLLSILPNENGKSQIISDWIALLGGIIIFMFGLLLFQSTLFAPTHPFK
ncbi:MAG: hypothetical protein CFH01_00352 [Alphaproteobacteria bacterium MarineAlpha2_Bin1]|nr:MAG: hypothetical protein CFH01_00352 [Alphaproteobacteria bacterium MarineAlpha2_Bin1]|tara:strand:- start:2312 stop:3280 length:969 start_codon:yes stop_codon:yes gene_type:complete